MTWGKRTISTKRRMRYEQSLEVGKGSTSDVAVYVYAYCNCSIAE